MATLLSLAVLSRVVLADEEEFGAEGLYVDVDTTGVYKETNGLDGLQTTETVIENGDEVIVIPADERLL